MNVAAITGCDGGIGASLTRIFADKGYTVIISYLDRNRFVSFMETLIPDSLLDALVKKMFSMYYGD